MTPTVHHASINVTDSERSVAFYQRFFGAEVEIRFEMDGDDLAALYGLPEADIRIVMLRIGDARVELIEFKKPTDAQRLDLRPHDFGFSHIGIRVDDARRVYRELVEAGVPFTRPPLSVGGGPDDEIVLAFFSDPDGNRIELVQLP